jgi:hypothetical protein
VGLSDTKTSGTTCLCICSVWCGHWSIFIKIFFLVCLVWDKSSSLTDHLHLYFNSHLHYIYIHNIQVHVYVLIAVSLSVLYSKTFARNILYIPFVFFRQHDTYSSLTGCCLIIHHRKRVCRMHFVCFVLSMWLQINRCQV